MNDFELFFLGNAPADIFDNFMECSTHIKLHEAIVFDIPRKCPDFSSLGIFIAH